jgi:hypothetical protein
VEENEFPAVLDEEDMELARKEWIIAGFNVTVYMDPGTLRIFTNVYDPAGDKFTRYIEGDGGVWLEVTGEPGPVVIPLHLGEY